MALRDCPVARPLVHLPPSPAPAPSAASSPHPVKTAEPTDIVLLMRLSMRSGRDILHGFSSYVQRTHCRWRLHVFNSDHDRLADYLGGAMASGVGGVVAHGMVRPVRDLLSSIRAPLVRLGAPSPGSDGAGPTAYVYGNETTIGRMGAAHLEAQGPFRALGFVGVDYCPERAEAFRAALAPRHDDIRMYGPRIQGDAGVALLAEWLRALPRPSAVMAAWDDVALRVLEAAERAGVRVPRDLAVLGVDNDELLCETSLPTLSSIDVDHVRMGGLAADSLRRMLVNPAQPVPDRLAPARGVVERLSTHSVEPSQALAKRAASFIRYNATRGIGAADVAAHLGASRSLVDDSFRRVTGESLLGMILRLRLEAVKAKLRETDLPISQVVASCGFATPTHAMTLFKRRFGCTMREWRRNAASGRSH